MLHIADAAAQERAKYAEIWTLPAYREHSPGLAQVEHFMGVMQPDAGASVIDLGAGACVGGLALRDRGLDVWWLDITAAGAPPEVDRRRFIEAPLWSDWSRSEAGPWDYGFCCDVLEHIPTEYTMLCVERILANCSTAWLQISLVPDEFGKAIGEPLHLTVRPFQWWLVRLATLGDVLDARDLCGAGLYVVRGRR